MSFATVTGFWLLVLSTLVIAHPASLFPLPSHQISNDNGSALDIGAGVQQKRASSVVVDLNPIKEQGCAFFYTCNPAISTTDDTYHPHLILDTGSGISWMLSTHLDQRTFPTSLHQFLPVGQQDCAPTLSEYGVEGSSLEVQLQFQSVKADLNGLELPDFQFGAAVSLTGGFSLWTGAEIDGILSMDRSKGSWLSKVIAASYKMDQFTIDIPRARLVLGDEGIVQMSEDRIHAELSDDSEDKWLIDSHDYGQILIDSGAPFLYITAAWADEWFDKTGANNWRYEEYNGRQIPELRCGLKPPDLQIRLPPPENSGEEPPTLTVPGSRLVGPRSASSSEWCNCRVRAVQPGELSALGIPFFEEYVTVFDVTYDEITFAKPA